MIIHPIILPLVALGGLVVGLLFGTVLGAGLAVLLR